MQAHVRIQDPDERNIGKVMALGDHLRSHKYLRFFRAELAQYARVRAFGTRAVVVHTKHAHALVHLGKLRGYLFRPHIPLFHER